MKSEMYWEVMLSQLLKEMDSYLANKPFQSRWWSRPLAVYMVIYPPLSKEYPLWKRNPDELRLFRLFNVSPEALKQKIDRYWQKPRWRRWFSAWGMQKKIDVWNYYQQCLAYQAVRADVLESVTYSSKCLVLFNELGLCFYQLTKKFDKHVEKRCRNPQWMKKNFAKEIKNYQQQLKKTFLTQLTKSLKNISPNEVKHMLKQQAWQEYQQLEEFMLRYYRQWLSGSFSNLLQPLVSEGDHNSPQAQNTPNPEYHLTVYPQPAGCSQQTFVPSDHLSQINSLHNIHEWINQQRQRLTLFVEEDSLQKVEALLQTSLNEIKNITELHLNYCEMVLSDIQDQPQTYDTFLNYFDNLQRRLKPLLQSGILLFHPDHIQHVGPSPAMWNLIGRFSQLYLGQNRYYVDRIKNYHQRTKAFCQHPHLQQGQRGKLEEKIKRLQQSFKELNKEFKELNKELDAFIERCAKDKAEMEAQRERLKAEMEAQRERDKAEMEAQRERDKAEMENNMKKLFEHFIANSSLATASAVDTEQSNKFNFFKP